MLRGDERREDVVDVVVAARRRSPRCTSADGARSGRPATLASSPANASAAAAAAARVAAPARRGRGQRPPRRRASNAASNSRSSARVLAPRALGAHPRVVDRVEQHRRLVEQVEHEHQHADQQHSACSGIFTYALISSDCAAFVDRLRRQVALHLALVAAEVRQHQEQAADACPTRTCRSCVRSKRKSSACSRPVGAGHVQRRRRR